MATPQSDQRDSTGSNADLAKRIVYAIFAFDVAVIFAYYYG